MALPGELRNEIWRLCLHDSKTVTVFANGRTRPHLGVALVSRQMRKEVLSLALEEQAHIRSFIRLQAEVLDLDFAPLFAFAIKAQRNHRALDLVQSIDIRLLFRPNTREFVNYSVVSDREYEIHQYIAKKIQLESQPGTRFCIDAELSTLSLVAGYSEPMRLRLLREPSCDEESCWDASSTRREVRGGSKQAEVVVERTKTLFAQVKGPDCEGEEDEEVRASHELEAREAYGPLRTVALYPLPWNED